MKTMQDLYKEITSNPELKAKFIEAAGAGRLDAFLKDVGCAATMEEITAFLKEKAGEKNPLSEEELDNLAGGGCNGATFGEAIESFVTVGIGCGAVAVISAAVGHTGQQNDDEGRVCNPD